MKNHILSFRDELLSSPHPLEKMGDSPEPPPKMARIERPSTNAQFGPEPPPAAAVKNLAKSATTTSSAQQSGGKKTLLVAPNAANSAPSTSTAKGLFVYLFIARSSYYQFIFFRITQAEIE